MKTKITRLFARRTSEIQKKKWNKEGEGKQRGKQEKGGGSSGSGSSRAHFVDGKVEKVRYY